MAKQKRLDEDWADKVPAAVQEAADNYIAALAAKGKACGKFNTAKDTLMSVMHEGKCRKVRVTYKDSEKIIELEDLEKIKLRKPEKTAGEDDGDDGDD